MGHQHRDALKTGYPLSENDIYDEAARKLGCFYRKALKGRPAGDRIESMVELSRRLSFVGVLQVEALPFHSESLPHKHNESFLREVDEHDLLGNYVGLLKEFLHRVDGPVVTLQASNCPGRRPTSPWLTWIARLVGLNLDSAERVSLKGNPEPTIAAWVSGRPRALVLRQGGTGLPADLAGLVRALQGR